MDTGGLDTSTTLTWDNVALAFSFVIFDAVASTVFGLGVGASLVTAAIRCIIQLALVGVVLEKVFEADNLWVVGSIVCK